MSKFLLNLLLEIFKALVNSKNPIFNSEILFLAFGAADPAARSASGPASPSAVPSPQAKIIPAGPSSPRIGHGLRGKYVFPFGSRLPEPAASPSPLCQLGPTCQIHPLPRAGRPQSEIPRASNAPELLQPSLITLPP
jgi:hypothetical protein